ncbi:MAG: penicillin-binding protein activator [Pseudomonadales bacterium]|nr:penicillin-binding protein activator [Pseudomonadales bacterium]
MSDRLPLFSLFRLDRLTIWLLSMMLIACSIQPGIERSAGQSSAAIETEAAMDTTDTASTPEALNILNARQALLQRQAEQALDLLPATMVAAIAEEELRKEARLLRIEALSLLGRNITAVQEHLLLAEDLNATQRIDNNNDIWELLSGIPANAPAASTVQIDSYELRGWLELLAVINTRRHNIPAQIQAVTQWQDKWNQHSASKNLPAAIAFVHQAWQDRAQHIALLLPLAEPAGIAVQEGFLAAYYQALAQGLPVPRISVHDTSRLRDVMPVYRRAVEQQADLVIGPLNKDLVRQLQGQRALPIPTLALNYGDKDRLTPGEFYQFGLAPEDEIMQTADLAWAAGHRNAAILTPTGEEYRRILETFSQHWGSLGGELVAQGSFSNNSSYADTIRQMMGIDASEARAASLRSLLPRNTMHFIPRRRKDIDFLFLLANPAEGRQLKPALSFYYAGDVPVYAMPAIYDGGLNSTANRDLNTIRFIDSPWILQPDNTLRLTVDSLWPTGNSAVQRLRAMGIDSYNLYPRLTQLARFPDTRLPGNTGILYMEPDGSIHRQLLTAQFINGAAVVNQVSP